MKLSDQSLLKTDAFIGGEWVGSGDGSAFPIFNPANSNEIAHVANCSASDTDKAIAAAEKALPEWRAKTAKERANILKEWLSLIHI